MSEQILSVTGVIPMTELEAGVKFILEWLAVDGLSTGTCACRVTAWTGAMGHRSERIRSCACAILSSAVFAAIADQHLGS